MNKFQAVVLKYFFFFFEGADIELKDKIGRTALLYSARYNRVDVLNYLLQKGADVNSVDCYGESILHLVVSQEFHELVQIILSKTKIDVNLINTYVLRQNQFTTNLTTINKVSRNSFA